MCSPNEEPSNSTFVHHFFLEGHLSVSTVSGCTSDIHSAVPEALLLGPTRCRTLVRSSYISSVCCFQHLFLNISCQPLPLFRHHQRKSACCLLQSSLETDNLSLLQLLQRSCSKLAIIWVFCEHGKPCKCQSNFSHTIFSSHSFHYFAVFRTCACNFHCCFSLCMLPHVSTLPLHLRTTILESFLWCSSSSASRRSADPFACTPPSPIAMSCYSFFHFIFYFFLVVNPLTFSSKSACFRIPCSSNCLRPFASLSPSCWFLHQCSSCLPMVADVRASCHCMLQDL